MAQLKSTVVQGALTVTGNAVANKLVKIGGTSDDILLGDGSTTSKSEIMGLINAAVVLKGTLGTGGTIESLPTAAASNLGHAYKVSVAGTYASQTAKVGDMFICWKSGTNSYAWMYIPSGDDIEDTWRPIKVNDTQILANGNTTGAINLKAGTNVSITNNSGTVTFAATDTGATSIETTGSGNAVTSGSYDASTRKITLTKGATFLTEHQSLANYVTLNGNQTITGIKTFSHSTFGAIVLKRNGSENASSIIFQNSNGTLGSIGMTSKANGGLKRWSANTDSSYTIWDSGNDGSGSGLDADLLDGKHASEFALVGDYLPKTTYEWNKEFAAGSNGAISLGRYYIYDTQLTFDITTTTSISFSGKLVIATQNGVIHSAKVFGDASGELASKLIIYQSAKSNSRSYVEIFCNFPGWSKNKVHIYAVALGVLDPPGKQFDKQMTSVTITNGVPAAANVESGDTKWTGTIVNDITTYDASHSGIGTCTTAAATAAKVVTLPRFALVENAIILVRVSTTNTATSGVTLNVNNTGAKSIYIGGSAWSTSNQLNAGDYLATYDGTYWKLTRIYLTDSNTTYGADRGISLVSENYGHSNTAVTPVTTAGLYKIKYDEYGHITGTDSFTLPTKDSWNYDDRYVKYNAEQSLTDTQKTQARTNIGAGTSNFSGSYNDLTDKPTIYNPANYYWANVKISSSSSTATTPSVQKLGITGSTTATATAAVTMEYDSSYKALKFVFA